jgi:outer membrane lipoprotein-sorting protein
LKRTEVLEVFKSGNRWYPKKILYHDLLQNRNGTEYTIDSVIFNADIPASKFTKAALKK